MRKTHVFTTARAALLVSLVATGPAAAQPTQGGGQGSWGVVHFPVSCSAAAQAAFDQVMVFEHSFAHELAMGKFQSTLQADTACSMAYWGMALAELNNPFLTPTQDGLDAANAMLNRADALGAHSPREAEYVAALRALIGKCHWDACTIAFAAAMQQLAAHYPSDTEAQVLYALALLLAAPPDDPSYAQQRKAADILNAELRLHPDHPGVAHYLIHAYDVPSLAADGLPAAERFTEEAQGSTHATHMPSHIFTRLGRWDDSIAANVHAVADARDEDMPNDELHASDYLVYAYLQTGRTHAAQAVQAGSRTAGAHLDPGHAGGPFAVAAIDARLALEPSDWEAAASLRVLPTASFPYVEAMTRYARALGLAHTGQLAAARTELAALAQIEQTLSDAGDVYWAEHVQIQFLSVGAWIAFFGGAQDMALTQMRAAANLEGTTNKNVVTPGPLAPARELLGEMLLQSGRAAAARAEFEASLKTEPRRFRSMFGAARAAENTGDIAGAKQHYAELLNVAALADTDRPELLAARAFVAGH